MVSTEANKASKRGMGGAAIRPGKKAKAIASALARPAPPPGLGGASGPRGGAGRSRARPPRGPLGRY